MKTIFSAAVLFALLLSQRAAAQFTLSCDSFCVLSIEMDTAPGFLAVTIQNDNAGHVNYPTVQVLDPAGNWIAGDSTLNFFAHMGNDQQTYVVPTSLDSVQDGFMATVILSEGIWDTICPLPFPCAGIVDNVEEKFETELLVYPVPVDDDLAINAGNEPFEFSLHDAAGRSVLRGTARGFERVPLSNVPNGVYALRVANREAMVVKKIIVQH